MANGHGGGGWCAVFIANRSNHRDSSYGAPGWVCSRVQTPPEVPPCPRGDAVFIERSAAIRNDKFLCNSEERLGEGAGGSLIR